MEGPNKERWIQLSEQAAVEQTPTKLKQIPEREVLPISPLSVVCPLCNAKPRRDCKTPSGMFSVLHVARIRAAAAVNVSNERNR